MSVVNYETGEIVERDPEEAAAVELLNQAIAALTTAIDQMPIGEVVNLKAKVATVQTATKELGMSKEAQELATEAVRRSEWALGRAVRKGQAAGEISTRADGGWTARNLHGRDQSMKKSADEFFGSSQQRTETFALAEAEPEEFEQALAEAKAEGNTSRANVVRKVKKQQAPLTRDAKADVIADLATRGYSSHQMADRVGVKADRVREIARAYDIEIPADKVMGRGNQRIDHTAAVESAVTRIEHLVDSLKFIDFTEVDGSEADEWAASLTHSIRALNRFRQQIKETTHVQ